MLQYPRGGLTEIAPADMWLDRRRLIAIRMYENCRATSTTAGSDIAPSISHKITIGEDDVVLHGRSVQHAWSGLAAGATIGIVVVTDANIVKG